MAINSAPDIREVFLGMFPLECPRRLVFMLRAFVDASVAGKPPVLSVAGFLGSVSGWSAFQRKWRQARSESGIPHFHMTDFMSRRATPYKDWPETKRTAVINRLIRLISNHTLFGVAVALNLSDFESQPAEEKILCGGNPYALCSAWCIGRAVKTLKERSINESIIWVFEAGDKGQPAFTTQMHRLFSRHEEMRDTLRVLSVMPGTKKQFPAFDAADFLAWQMTQHVPRMEGGHPAPMTPYLDSLSVPIYSHYMRGDSLRSWAVGYTAKERAFIRYIFGVRFRERTKGKKLPIGQNYR